jgi:hypothetical protein
MSDEDNFLTFDPTQGEEGEALRDHARASFIRKKVHQFEDVCTRYMLTSLNVMDCAPVVKRYNQDNLAENRLSVFAANMVVPNLPVWFFSRRVNDLHKLRLAQLFKAPAKTPFVKTFLEGRDASPSNWRNRTVMILGPILGLGRNSRNLLVVYSRNTAPVNAPRLIAGLYVVQLPDEDLIVRPAADYFQELNAEYRAN